jgi:hypothetical protein
MLEDGLSSNCPHITNLIDHTIRFILEATPGDYAHLFAQLDRAIVNGEVIKFYHTIQSKAGITHTYLFVNGVSLNKSNPGLLVNVLEYWQLARQGKEIMFGWVTYRFFLHARKRIPDYAR